MENINDFTPVSRDWHRERLDTLKQLMPDLFTDEGKLNGDEIKKMAPLPKKSGSSISIEESERYEFRWFGKSQAKRNAFTPSNATLIFDEKRSLNPSETENSIIEGENLEVLKLLSGAYREKIKCIYIDPPYNTGKDFVYSDNFTQDKKAYWTDAGILENGVKVDTNAETDGRYHSNWLNMMYSRLLIARQLLRGDGVIFISIDDNEVHNLRKLCDEVFGEENFAGQIVWQTATDNNPTQIATEHEYVICYLKDKNEQGFWEVPSEKGKIIETQYETLKALYKEDFGLIQTELRKWLKKQAQNDDLSGVSHYSYVDEKGVFYPGNSANTKPGGYAYDIIHPITKQVCAKPEYGYRFTFDTFQKAAERGDVVWSDDEKNIPRIKKRLNTITQKLKSYYYEDNRATTGELKALFGGVKVFNNPKSVNFLKHIFKFVVEPNDLILDFFGGSGTIGQAVMEMNHEDNGNRKYILIQMPEATDPKSEPYKAGYKKISDITIERNKRVIDKLKAENRGEVPLYLGFKVFKLAPSHFPRVEFAPDPHKTDEENIDLLKKYISKKEAQLYSNFNQNDLMSEILLKKGFSLNYTLFEQKTFTHNAVFLASDGENELLICLDTLLDMETIVYFEAHSDKKFLCLERALDTTKKWHLRQVMGDKFMAF